MQCVMKKIAMDLKLPLPDLITRPVGRKMYEKVRKMLSVLHNEEVVALDFGGVKVVDSSFIDEFLLRLILEARSAKPAYFIKILNFSDAVEVNCESVFSSYRRFNNERAVVITDRVTGNNSVFLGALSAVERDIVDYLHVNRTARIGDIAAYVGKSEEEASALADSLYLLRVVRREKDDGNFRYTAL
jgi:hypothetical protein